MFYPPEIMSDNPLVNVAEITVGEEFIKITCFPKTGSLFMNGKFAPKNMTIRETLEWYMKESMDDYEIQELFFQKGINHPRPAHPWELNTFLHGHWRAYAKNNVQIFAKLVDDIFIDIG